MGDYSLFSSSTNSESSSSCDNYFPFSLDHITDNPYEFFLDNHDNQDDHDNNGSVMAQVLEIPMVQSPLVLDDSYHNHDINNGRHVNYNLDQDDGDHHHAHNEEIFIINDDDNSKLAKKVSPSSSKKKIKKHRYAFQTRSQVDILDDGYRWRKYGQKTVKNNTFPRGYYRCTYQGCKVKKQVQRLSDDDGIVVTTYEGVHSHPIQKPTDNFEQIMMSKMQIHPSCLT